MNDIGTEFYLLTQSLLSHDRSNIPDRITDVLTHAFYDRVNQSSNSPVFGEEIYQAKSPDILIKLFEKRTCQMSIVYPWCLKLFDFLYSLLFGFNRHTLAIFFGNALPSFIVVLANLLSLRAIFCSKSLKYLKETSRKTRRKRRLQSDLRAFLVILIQSFSVIMITWGIPIFLTIYHCGTLYVVSIEACPRIKNTLAVFLFTDLFNSSTNCLLYSLSGKLFRRNFSRPDQVGLHLLSRNSLARPVEFFMFSLATCVRLPAVDAWKYLCCSIASRQLSTVGISLLGLDTKTTKSRSDFQIIRGRSICEQLSRRR